MNEDHGTQLLFAKKSDVLNDITQIYDCLIDITKELYEMKNKFRAIETNQHALITHINHLRNIISKDLIVRGSSPVMQSNTLHKLKMSRAEWHKYINSSISPDNNKETTDEDDEKVKESTRLSKPDIAEIISVIEKVIN